MHINPTTDYLTVTLPIDSNKHYVLDVFKRSLHPNEGLYLGKIPKEELKFVNDSKIFSMVHDYFYYKKYEKNLDAADADKNYDRVQEDFPKLCWLTDDFTKTHSFRDPIVVHYNPRTCENVIHPGGTRNIIIKLFHAGPVKCLYFNTSGVQFEWMDNNLKLINTDRFKTEYNMSFHVVADHGSLIPHILFNSTSIPDMIAHYHLMIQSTLKTFQFSSNIKIDFLAEWQVDHSPVYFQFSANYSQLDICKAVILGMLKRSFVSETLKVITNGS